MTHPIAHVCASAALLKKDVAGAVRGEFRHFGHHPAPTEQLEEGSMQSCAETPREVIAACRAAMEGLDEQREFGCG